MTPYLTLCVLTGNARYQATANDSYVEIVSLSRNKASFTTYRTGLGLNIAIIKALALEVEANYSGGVPAVNADTVNSSGTRSERVLFDGSPVVNLAVGVRYYF